MNAQPIATAPRDGTHILAANLKQTHPIWTAVHWFDDGWFLSVNELEIHAGWQCDRLTHWLPQPSTSLPELSAEPSQAVTANELRELRNQMALISGRHLDPDAQQIYEAGAKSAADILDRLIRKRFPI